MMIRNLLAKVILDVKDLTITTNMFSKKLLNAVFFGDI
jgi:hypothetical protein